MFFGLSKLICLQAALKKSNLEVESELMVKLNNIEMMNEAAEMKDKIIKVTMEIRSILTTPSNAMVLLHFAS